MNPEATCGVRQSLPDLHEIEAGFIKAGDNLDEDVLVGVNNDNHNNK